jgi:hypothetical protein
MWSRVEGHCAACHATAPRGENKIGTLLVGIVGNESGGVPGPVSGPGAALAMHNGKSPRRAGNRRPSDSSKSRAAAMRYSRRTVIAVTRCARTEGR